MFTKMRAVGHFLALTMFKGQKQNSNAVTAGGVQSSSFAKACPRHCQHHPGSISAYSHVSKNVSRHEESNKPNVISTSEGIIKEPDTFYVNKVQGKSVHCE
jgi:hypothetical protein